MPTLTAPIADSPAGQSLNSIFQTALQDNLAGRTATTEPVETSDDARTDDAKPEPVAQDKPPVEDKAKPTPEKPAQQDKTKPEPKSEASKSDPKAEKPAPDTGKREKLSDLPPDQKDFVLMASQKRQLEAFNAKNERIKVLEGEVEPLKTQLAELSQLKETAPKELEQLRAEVERLKSENTDYDGKVKAFDVQQTREYRQSVQDPWNEQIVGKVEDKVAQGGLNLLAAQLAASGHTEFNGQKALEIIQNSDEVALELMLNSLPTDRARMKLSGLYDEGQRILAKHKQLTTDSGNALKAIKERQTQAEKEAADSVKAEVGRIGTNLSQAVANRFPFLNGEEGNEQLNGALAKAKEAMASFDITAASPQERAEAAHARAYAPIIATFLETEIRKRDQLLQDKDTEHAKVETELREQIAALEDRLGNLNGEVQEVQPGNRDGKGRFAPTEDSTALFKRLTAGKR